MERLAPEGEEMGGQAAGGGDPQEIIRTLVNMGINQADATVAVRQTGAESVEAAINYVFENAEKEEQLAAEAAESSLYEDYKMVFIVNTSLPMSTGKVAAQVAHGALDLYKELISKQEHFGGPILQWNENGSKKVVLQADNAEELKALAKKAESQGLPYAAIEDAGRTQIPSGSHTVLAIFGLSNSVDQVTGHLKLL